MLKIVLTIINGFVQILKVPFCIMFLFFVLFGFLVFIQIMVEQKQGRRMKKGSHKKLKKRSVWKRLLIDLPKQYVDDLFSHDPDFFRYQGLIVYTGRQGMGKTISMVRDTMQMQKEYPLSRCITNLNYTRQNGELNHWQKLIKYKNGKRGVIAVLDELQNWFSSNQSRNFPPEMLEVITQNRKNRRVILGTAQNFYLLAKAIRSQCTEVRECITLLGCLTVVRRREPVLDSDGNVVEWKRRGMYFYVHDKEIRESYDTYHVIESLSKSGFQERSQDIVQKVVVSK